MHTSFPFLRRWILVLPAFVLGNTAAAQVTVAVHDINPGTAISRNACLSIPAGRYAAVECGDLRVVQAVMGTTTMNKERAPVLTYLSRHAIPGGVIAVDVAIDSTIEVSNSYNVLLIMTIPGKDTVSRSVSWDPSWNNGQTRRLVLPFDALAKSVTTGAYTYTLEARARKGNGTVLATASVSDTLVVVDRSASPFGVGWWLQGLEMLSTNTPSDSLKLWIGGDGSTRLYKQLTSTVWKVVPSIDKPDTLLKVTVGETITWRRSLGNNAYVEFDNTGRHIATVNDLGHKTRFVHSTALDSIVLPVPSGSAAIPAYVFKYVTVSGSPMLDTLHAPKYRIGLSTIMPRYVRTTRSGRVIKSFSATDWSSAHTLTVDTVTGRINGGTRSSLTITWGSGLLVTDVQVGSIGTTTICPVEGISLLSCASSPALSTTASTSINGPRTDVSDTTRIWHTRYGAARRIRNALGDTTAIFRDNATFPLLITKTVGPTGLTQRASYTTRGLMDSSVVVDPLGTSTNAVTLYSWDGTFNRVTQVTSPTGDVTTFSYTGSGLPSYQQDGRGSSTRTNFYLDGANRLEYVQPPGHNNTTERFKIEYDTLHGNIKKTTTPLGFVTEYTRDTLGRVATGVVPVDTAGGSGKTKRTISYDTWNRPIETWDQLHTGPISYTFSTISGNASSSSGGPLSALQVAMTYDNEGNRTKVVRRNSTYTGTDTVLHAWQYNVLGQVTREDYSDQEAIYHTYDPAGNETYTSTQGVYVTRWMTMVYDAVNRLVERRTPGASFWGPRSSPDTSFMAFNTPFPYFGVAFPARTTPADTARFTYDAAGNQLTAYNFDARIKRSYYPNGLIKTDTLRIRPYTTTSNPDTDFAAHAYGIKYEYDLSGRRTAMQVPTNLGTGCTTGSSVDCFQLYHYLAHVGAVDSITSIFGQHYTFSYDDKSRLSARTAPGGVTLAWTYDLEDRAVRREEKRGVGILSPAVTVHLDSLWYDARAKVRLAKLGGTVDPFQIVRLAYNHQGHMAAAEFERTASPTSTANEEFVHDGLGNIRSSSKNRNISALTITNTVDTIGRLTAQNKTPASGAFTGVDFNKSMPDSYSGAQYIKSALDFNWTNCTWSGFELTYCPNGRGYESEAWHGMDGKMRFFQRVGPDTNPETRFVAEEYRYDALGRRVALRSRTRSSCTANFCKPSMERYIWDGNQLLAQIRVPGDSGASDATLEADTASGPHYGRIMYVHGTGIDAPIGLDRNGTVIIPHANWRGFYDAGADSSGGNYTSNINWVGREQDSFLDAKLPRTVGGWSGSLLSAQQDNSGLLFRRNRYYDPGTGRFTQSDPIGLAGGTNLYGYAAGDPVNRSDPFGLCSRKEASCTDHLHRAGRVPSQTMLDALDDYVSGSCRAYAEYIREMIENGRVNIYFVADGDRADIHHDLGEIDVYAGTFADRRNLANTLIHEAVHHFYRGSRDPEVREQIARSNAANCVPGTPF